MKKCRIKENIPKAKLILADWWLIPTGSKARVVPACRLIQKKRDLQKMLFLPLATDTHSSSLTFALTTPPVSRVFAWQCAYFNDEALLLCRAIAHICRNRVSQTTTKSTSRVIRGRQKCATHRKKLGKTRAQHVQRAICTFPLVNAGEGDFVVKNSFVLKSLNLKLKISCAKQKYDRNLMLNTRLDVHASTFF